MPAGQRLKARLEARGVHGLPPIGGQIKARGRRTQEQSGGAALSKRQAYKLQINPLLGDAVNPTAPQRRLKRIKGTRPGDPRIRDFGLPANWKLKRTVRHIPAVDNLYYGPCGSKQNKPRLRSLTQVYKCLYTNKVSQKKYCKGSNKKEPCDEAYAQLARQELTERGLTQQQMASLDQILATAAQQGRLPEEGNQWIDGIADRLPLFPRRVRPEMQQILDTLRAWRDAQPQVPFVLPELNEFFGILDNPQPVTPEQAEIVDDILDNLENVNLADLAQVPLVDTDEWLAEAEGVPFFFEGLPQ